MNKKRKYLCLLSRLIAEKIITNQDNRLSNEVSIKVANNDMQIRVVFSEPKTHKNFSIWMYEFQSFKSLIEYRKIIFKYLDNSDYTLETILERN